jgi:hypothetical protein
MSVDKKYIELLNYLVQPRGHDHAGDKTICYLTFDNNDIQYVKRKMNEGWVELAKNKGLQPGILSLHTTLKNFYEQDDYRIEAGEDAVDDEYQMNEVYESLGENLRHQNVLEKAILDKQEELLKIENGVLIITDLEAMDMQIKPAVLVKQHF